MKRVTPKVELKVEWFAYLGACLWGFIEFPATMKELSFVPLLILFFARSLLYAENISWLIAWLIGLFLDLLSGSYLGTNCFALLICWWWMYGFRAKLSSLGRFGTSCLVGVNLVIYQFIISLLHYYFSHTVS